MPTLSQLFHSNTWRRPWRWLLCALLLVVTCAALSPGSQAPTLGASDKLDHLLAFLALGVAAALSLRPAVVHYTAACAALLAYGAMIELLQTQLPGRHADVMDLAVDAIGIATGVALALGVRRWWPAAPH